MRSLQRVMVVAAAAGVLSVGVPHVVPSVPANAAVSARSNWDDGRNGEQPSGEAGNSNSPNTTTTTATCGNGLIALGPIVVPLAPHTTTVIQCEAPPTADPSSW